ncbi:hypothetical protein GCM10027046_00070 [Uliginosibacterium flavum]
MTTPCETLRKHREEIIASFKGSQEAVHLFYLATVKAASDEVRICLAEGKSVILDRYFLSTQAYAEFRGSQLNLDYAMETELIHADITIYLEAPLEVRRERTAARGCSTADNETLSPSADSMLRKAYGGRSSMPVVGKWLRLDTAQASIDEVVHTIAAYAVHWQRGVS